jgi:hypothetical protein
MFVFIVIAIVSFILVFIFNLFKFKLINFSLTIVATRWLERQICAVLLRYVATARVGGHHPWHRPLEYRWWEPRCRPRRRLSGGITDPDCEQRLVIDAAP